MCTSGKILRDSKLLSPCIKVCKLRENTCIGCGRTLTEIKNWPVQVNEEVLQLRVALCEVLALLDRHIEVARPAGNCPDRLTAWAASGYNHRAYQKAVKILEDSEEWHTNTQSF